MTPKESTQAASTRAGRARDSAPTDRFGTAELRRRVLDAWRDSPARLRADANVEDDLALVGYRDRLIVELAQNAADAATRGGVAGRLRLTLDGRHLRAANTGAPLDAAGVESISVARASAKLGVDASVGRFGVGFAAVLSVSDEPVIRSRSGAVRWSRDDARRMVAELAAESGQSVTADLVPVPVPVPVPVSVPVLRLPLPASGEPPDGYDTEVELSLRDEAAVDVVRGQLAGLDPTLLLSLPSLTEVIVRIADGERTLRRSDSDGVVTVHDGAEVTRWSVSEQSGPLDPALLADQPAEDRHREQWSVTCALPVDADGRLTALPDTVARVMRAPTATDDQLSLPVVVIASYPLDSTRRRVTTGHLADAVTEEVARVLVEAVAASPPTPTLLTLVPSGVPVGELDAALHTAVRRELESVPWLPAAGDETARLRPRDAVVVADELVSSLADVIPGVLPVGWSNPLVVSLGARRPTVAELIDAVSVIDATPSWWRELYDGLAASVPAGPERDALGALPVPLVNGELVTGPRSVVLADPDAGLGDLTPLGVRIAHPDAVHPLLRSLGAAEAGGRDVLALPQVREAVETSIDHDEPDAIVEAVISVVAAAGADAAELPWLAELALPDATGEWRPAGELLLPGGAMAAWVAADSGFGVVASDAVARWSGEALVRVGVLDRPAVVRDDDVTGPDHDLDDEDRWWATLPDGAALPSFAAVRDLEQLRDDAFSEVVAMMSTPPLREVLVEPTVVVSADGASRRVRSYTAWWLGSRPVLDGRAPAQLRLANADESLSGLYDVAPATFDDEVLRALGVVSSLADADPDDVLDRLAEPGREVTRDALRTLYAWLAEVHPSSAPLRVRAVKNGALAVVTASESVVVDAPDLLPLLRDRAVVPVAAEFAVDLARWLGLRLASGLASYEVVSEGVPNDDAVVHDPLFVRDADGRERHVPWRLIDGVLHVDAGQLAYGLGRGRAWRDGEWSMRHRRTEEAAMSDVASLAAEDDLDDW
jgi:hypothetical protein